MEIAEVKITVWIRGSKLSWTNEPSKAVMPHGLKSLCGYVDQSCLGLMSLARQ